MGASFNSGGGRRGRGTRGTGGFNEINITPFVDVMLVLLIIFMVTAPMMTSAIQVDLPKVKASAAAGANDEPISVSIKRDGTVYIQNTEITVDKLGAKLKAILGEKVETRIFVRGDTSADYGNVMKAISAITSAGYTKVALLTDQSGVPPK